MKGRFVHTLLLALVPVLFSCSRQEEPVQRYEYRLALAEDGTKAVLNDAGVHWESGDKVGLFLGNGTSVEASVDATTSPKTIVFSTSQALADGTEVRAYYPYVANNTNASAAKVSFPETQTGGSHASMPMAGIPFKIDGNGKKGLVHFVNLGAVIDFKVYAALHRETVQSITLAVTGGTHAVSGEARLDLTGVVAGKESSLELDWGQGSPNSSVALTQSQAIAVTKAAESGHQYMVVAPGTYSGNITVVTDMATYTLPFENLTFTRNAVQRVTVNLEGENVVREGPVFSLENETVATYLDDVYQNPYNPADYSYTLMKTEYYKGKNTVTTNRLDWPKPVPVSWTNPSSGNGSKVVYVYNDADMTDLELSVEISSTTATSVDIYNLIPGRTYYYKVTLGDQPYTIGSFKTTGRRRMMKVGDSPYGMGYANNCRDFGGQHAMDGKTIKYGKMFRGSNMDLTTDKQKEFLLNYMKVALDVDLRTTQEDKEGEGKGHLYDALGLGDMHTTEKYNSWGELTTVASMNATLTKILDAVAAGKVPYIHCKVGADRTGYVCMLLEAILGVPQEWCDVDYELTSFSGAVDNGEPRRRTGEINYYYRTKREWTGTSIRGVDYINTISGDTFQDKAINYIVNTLGVPQDKITAFQNNMLE